MKEIDWGGFRRTKPIDRACGLKRGTPIDRYYIERFLERERKSIKGVVLEFLDANYTTRFGAARVRISDVMVTANDKNRKGYIVGNLEAADFQLPDNRYNCIIATQVLQYMKRPLSAITSLRQALKPGGTLLGTWSQTTRTDAYERKRWPFMSAASLHQIEWFLRRVFGNCEVEVHGNILALTSFLWGLCLEDVNESELDVCDPDYPLIVSFKAVKS